MRFSRIGGAGPAGLPMKDAWTPERIMASRLERMDVSTTDAPGWFSVGNGRTNHFSAISIAPQLPRYKKKNRLGAITAGTATGRARPVTAGAAGGTIPGTGGRRNGDRPAGSRPVVVAATEIATTCHAIAARRRRKGTKIETAPTATTQPATEFTEGSEPNGNK